MYIIWHTQCIGSILISTWNSQQEVKENIILNAEAFAVWYPKQAVSWLCALRPPWRLFWGGCNLTLMCCEWETWARIKTGPHILTCTWGSKGLLMTQMKHNLKISHTLRRRYKYQLTPCCYAQTGKTAQCECCPSSRFLSGFTGIKCWDKNNSSVFATTRSASQSIQTKSPTCALAFKL